MSGLRKIAGPGLYRAARVGPNLMLLLVLTVAAWLTVEFGRPDPRVARAGLAAPAGVITSSYFGGNGDDIITAVAFAPDGDVILAGQTSNPGSFVPAGTPLGPATGVACSPDRPAGFVARLSADGRTRRWLSYLECGAGALSRLAVDNAGTVYLAGLAYDLFPGQPLTCGGKPVPSGGAYPLVAKLSATGASLDWAKVYPGAEALDDVQIALTAQQHPLLGGRAGPNLFLAGFDTNGICGFEKLIADANGSAAPGALAGLIVKPADDTIFVTGHFQRFPQVPFLAAYNAAGQELWRAYSQPLPANLTANSQGRALALAPDGSLLAAFVADGAANPLEHSPQNPASPRIPQLNGAYRPFHNLTSNLPVWAGFVGRYQAATGQLQDATYFYSADASGNTARTIIGGLQVDVAGRIYLAGLTNGLLPTNQDSIQPGLKIAPEGYLVSLDREMSSLTYATYLGSSKVDEIKALALKSDRLALGGITDGNDLTTHLPAQASSKGYKDGLLAIFHTAYNLQLTLAAAPGQAGVNRVSGPLRLELKDIFSGATAYSPAAVTVQLSSSCPTGRFDLTGSGAFNLNSVTIEAGSGSATFYYLDSMPGDCALTFAPGPAELNKVTHALTVVQLRLDPAGPAFKANRLGALPPARSLPLSFNGPGAPGWEVVGSPVYGPGATDWLAISPTSGALSQPIILEVLNVPPVSPTPYTAVFMLRDTQHLSTLTVTVTYRVNDVRLAILSQPQKVGAGYTSGRVWVETQDELDATPVRLAGDLTFSIASSSGSGLILTDPQGSAVAGQKIEAGKSRAAFYYRDSLAGSFTLAVSAAGFDQRSQSIEIVNPSECQSLPPTQVNNSDAGLPPDSCQITLEKALAAGGTVTFPAGGMRVILSGPLLLNGKTLQGGCNNGKPEVWLDGWSAEPGSAGLELAGNNNLTGLAIFGFGGPGLKINSGRTTAACLFLGTADGLAAQPNGKALIVGPGGKLDLAAGPTLLIRQRS